MLSVSEVSAEYSMRTLFTKLTFEVRPGECVQVTGDNGAGKSTLIKMIASLKAPSAGHIQLSDQYQTIYVGHELGLMDALTVEQNLSFYDELYESDVPIDAILRKHHLWALKDRTVRQLSRGQQQRVALSRLSMTEPSTLWLLDEPMTGLDKTQQSVFSELMAWHSQRQGMIVLTSHYDTIPAVHRQVSVES